MLLALKIQKSAESGKVPHFFFWEFADFHSQGHPGRENQGGTRSMGGVQYNPLYLPNYIQQGRLLMSFVNLYIV